MNMTRFDKINEINEKLLQMDIDYERKKRKKEDIKRIATRRTALKMHRRLYRPVRRRQLSYWDPLRSWNEKYAHAGERP